MKVGVAVEGPSDRVFWDKILHKHFPAIRFDVRNMKTREKLIQQSSRLLEQFRSLHYTAGFVLLDREKDPCTAAVFQRFDTVVISEAQQPLHRRYLSICIAIRGLESWFLADQYAINALLPCASYSAPSETATLNPRSVLTQLWRQQYGKNSSPNRVSFARNMAPIFDPEIAKQHSGSFTYFWTRLKETARSST